MRRAGVRSMARSSTSCTARALALALTSSGACRDEPSTARARAGPDETRVAGLYEREQRMRASAQAQRTASATTAPSTNPSAAPWVPASNDEGDFVLQQLALRAASLPDGMTPVLGPLRVALERETHTHPFLVRPGHCYRVLAVGGLDSSEISLVLRDPTGLELDRDTPREPWASLGERRPWCPAIAGAYTVDVTARGGLAYGIGVYGTR